jgi:hypothetical protein
MLRVVLLLKDISFFMLSPKSSCFIFSLSKILIATSSPVLELVAYFTLFDKRYWINMEIDLIGIDYSPNAPSPRFGPIS